MHTYELVVYLCCLIISLVVSENCIMWTLEPNSQICLKEELQQDMLVLGIYEVSEAPGQKVDYVVRDSKGHILSQHEDISKGRFAFVTENNDGFEICFISHVPQHQIGIAQQVSLVIKRGVEAKNYKGNGEAAKLKPID